MNRSNHQIPPFACERCRGYGWAHCHRCAAIVPNALRAQPSVVCAHCRGTGLADCMHCDGFGYTPVMRLVARPDEPKAEYTFT
jgi:DnaJ-class molecular chaperone